jgi:GTP cyclohydrolase II
VFAKADKISLETGMRDQAICLVQNAADLLKESCGDMQKAAEKMGAAEEKNCWVVYYKNNGDLAKELDEAAYRLEWKKEEPVTVFLGEAQIAVYTVNVGLISDAPVFTLKTAWQEVQ